MPATFGSITVPCMGEPITVASFSTFALGVEATLSPISALVTKALLRPAAVISSTGVAYTAGVFLTPSYATEILDTDNMFTLAAPTILTIQTAGTYLATLNSSSNLAATNTSHRAEILVNGVVMSFTKSGSGITGNQPPNPLSQQILLPTLSVGDTISTRILISGVGNDFTFPQLSAALVSYGV